MKLLLENWKGFLKEQNTNLPQIYCDMDGVLVDFEQGVVNQINKDLKVIRQMRDIKNLSKIQNVLDRLGIEEVTIDHFRGSVSEAEKFDGALRNYMYGRVGNDADFWAKLPWMPGGKELWSFISSHNPHILTSPMQKGSEIGKAFWIDENLNPKPDQIYMSSDKYKWALDNTGEPNILIDDWSKNTVPWDKKGGIAIQHVNGNTAATIATLKELGFS
jgi:hypothetical protein